MLIPVWGGDDVPFLLWSTHRTVFILDPLKKRQTPLDPEPVLGKLLDCYRECGWDAPDVQQRECFRGSEEMSATLVVGYMMSILTAIDPVSWDVRALKGVYARLTHSIAEGRWIH